jgi:hypothetical protein
MCARFRILIAVVTGLLGAGTTATAGYAVVAGWDRGPVMLYQLALAAAVVAAVVLVVRCELVPAARRSFAHGERLAAITTDRPADDSPPPPDGRTRRGRAAAGDECPRLRDVSRGAG